MNIIKGCFKTLWLVVFLGLPASTQANCEKSVNVQLCAQQICASYRRQRPMPVIFQACMKGCEAAHRQKSSANCNSACSRLPTPRPTTTNACTQGCYIMRDRFQTCLSGQSQIKADGVVEGTKSPKPEIPDDDLSTKRRLAVEKEAAEAAQAKALEEAEKQSTKQDALEAEKRQIEEEKRAIEAAAAAAAKAAVENQAAEEQKNENDTAERAAAEAEAIAEAAALAEKSAERSDEAQ